MMYTLAIPLYINGVPKFSIYFTTCAHINLLKCALYRMLRPKPVLTPSHITLTKFNQ